jgi:acylphosphatase
LPGRPVGQQPDQIVTHQEATTRLDASVSGRVQGVGFRYFVLREAMALGLDGWVANAPDGSVRCVAEGAQDVLEQLLERLHEGPAAAAVDRVSAAWMPATGTLGRFAVRSGGHPGD